MDEHNITQGRHGGDPSRPALGFPLGTALLLMVIFCLSGIFSCCYHWDKLRSLRRSFSRSAAGSSDALDAPAKPSPLRLDANDLKKQSLPVLMPGDKIPKFIAWPCPCEPSPLAPPVERLTVEVQTPPPQPQPC